MTIQQAIQKAIEGGWRPKEFPLEEKSDDILVQVATEKELEENDDLIYPIMFSNLEYPEEGYYYSTDMPHIIIDPLFWQALGKSMGWKYAGQYTQEWSNMKVCSFDEWVYKWHLMVEHLADGGTIESYFEQLN